jgi:GTP-binding protein EngB required for normal cell division
MGNSESNDEYKKPDVSLQPKAILSTKPDNRLSIHTTMGIYHNSLSFVPHRNNLESETYSYFSKLVSKHDIRLVYTLVNNKFNYRAYYILVCGKYFGYNHLLLEPTVEVITETKCEFITEHEVLLTMDQVKRMSIVAGLSSYSVCFNNGEHVARFVYNGSWTSIQTTKGGGIYEYFKKKIGKNKVFLNIIPGELEKPFISTEGLIYNFIKRYISFSHSVNKIIDQKEFDEKRNNILVIGPTGSGKSRIINCLFNKTTVDSINRLEAVTRDINFHVGHIYSYDDTDKKEQKEYIIADTIGICDSELSNDDVLRLIKDKTEIHLIKVHLVVVVVKMRVEGSHIRNIRRMMNWLNYEKNKDKFIFIINFSDTLSQQAESNQVLELNRLMEMDSIGELGNELTFCTSFPDENFNEDRVVKSHNKLMKHVDRINPDNYIEVNKSKCIIL